MSLQQDVYDFLNDAGVFYLSTLDADGAPVTRPLGFKMMVDGQLYFGVGTFKSVYTQMQADPRVYICATKPDGANWIRIAGSVVLDDDPALVEKVWENAPQLKDMYEANGWEMGVFHFASGKVTFMENLAVPARTEEF